MRAVHTKSQPKRAVFVDDDAATNMLNIKAAQQAGLADEFCAYTSARDALETLSNTEQEKFPDYLFVDVNMPRMNGHDFIRALKTVTTFDQKQTCVVFLTGSLDIKDVVEADQNEVQHYHWKPLKKADIEEIKSAAIALLSQR